MAKEIFEYLTFDASIMPGFYESILYNSDTEYYYNKDHEYEEDFTEKKIKDFNGFKNTTTRRIVDEVISPLLTKDASIIDSVKFKEVVSPREYNFQTDKILMEINVDYQKLKDLILSNEEMKSGFDNYLKKHFTSRDGFVSFVANNITEYFNKWKHLDVMVDYYLLTKIYDTYDVAEEQNITRDNETKIDYDQSLYQIAEEVLEDFLEPIDEE